MGTRKIVKKQNEENRTLQNENEVDAKILQTLQEAVLFTDGQIFI